VTLRSASLSLAVLGALAVGAIAPAVAQSDFASFSQLNTGNWFLLNVGPGTLTATTDVNFTDTLAGQTVTPAHMTFTATEVAGTAMGAGMLDQNFTSVTIHFWSAFNANLLTVTGTGDVSGKINGKTGAFTGDSSLGQTVTYTSAIPDIAAFLAGTSGGNYSIGLALGGGTKLNSNGQLLAHFGASGAGTFQASPVPEMSTLVGFGGLFVGGGLLGLRRRRA